MAKSTGMIGVFALVVGAPLAQADFVISYSLDGGATTTQCASSMNNMDPNTAAVCFDTPPDTNLGQGITISNMSGSGSQAPGVSQQTNGTISVRNTGTSTVTTMVLKTGASTNFIATQTLTPVPEPASLILLGSGLLGACFLLRRKMPSKRA